MKLNLDIFKKKPIPDYFYELPEPNGSIEYFEKIKILSEKYWQETNINENLSGFQVQKESKWKDGLSENQLVDFQVKLNIEFPNELKNFYRTMNGLDKKGINVFGKNCFTPSLQPIYYSFPEDLELIKDKIEYVYKSNGLSNEVVETERIPKIFPITGHRFLIIDENTQILSMFSDDIVFWSESISKLVANEIFDNILNVTEFESNPNLAKQVKFWL